MAHPVSGGAGSVSSHPLTRPKGVRIAMHVPASSPFFDRAYHEAMGLLVEARNYVAFSERRDRDRLPLLRRLELSCEAMRVTSRLTQIMAWLLLHRAVQNGEITLSDACSDENRLGCDTVCLDNEAAENVAMPAGIRSLLDRSYSLYVRISRMDAMVRTQVLN